MRIVFLCSGGGGNLRFVATAIDQGWLKGTQICAVLSDRTCAAHTVALTHGFHAQLMDFSDAGQAEVLRKLRSLSPDVIVTTVHKILNPDIVDAFAGKLLNLHYALLPAFAGAIGERPVRQAVAYGARFAGITVHLVDDRLDLGRPLFQAVTAIQPNQDHTALMDRLFRSGCLSLLQAIASFLPTRLAGNHPAQATVMLGGQPVHFNPGVIVPPALLHESGWAALRGVRAAALNEAPG